MYKYVLGICLLSVSLFAQTATPAPTPSSEREERVVAGLQWTFGKGFIPVLVVGYRNVLIASDDDVKGIASTLTYDFIKNSFDKFKISGIYGDVDFTGELSLGYSFLENSFLAGIGGQANYINVNADYLYNKGFDYSLQLNSINDEDFEANPTSEESLDLDMGDGGQ